MSSFYENAPVSLTMSLLTILSTMLYSGFPGRFALDVTRLMHGQVGRLFSAFFVFNSPSQAFLAILMLYSYRLFERQLGSSKYAAFLVFAYVCSLLVSLIVMALGNMVGLYVIPASGPYFFLFAQLPFYYRYVPKITMSQYVFLGLEISEKSWVYLLALQLLFSEGLSSVLSGLIGLLVGYVYFRDNFGLQKLRMPAFIMKIFTFFGSMFNALFPTTPVQRGNRGAPGAPQGGQGGFPPNHDFFGNNLREQAAPQQPAYQVAPPSEEAIQMLMGLGFEREAVIQALRSADNNVDAAANRLLR